LNYSIISTTFIGFIYFIESSCALCYLESVNGHQQRKLRSKESILRSALELFAENGIRRVSVAEIAKKSGVNPVTIYNHFGNRNALVREVIRGLVMTQWTRFREILTCEQPFLQRLERIISEKNEMAALYDGALMKSAVSADSEIRQMVRSLFENEVNPLLVKFLKCGQKEGAVRSDLSIDTLRIYIDMFTDVARAYPELFADPRRLSKTTREIWSLFLYGISGRAVEPRSEAT
jgi:AcrR family transcriptional regulator